MINSWLIVTNKEKAMGWHIQSAEKLSAKNLINDQKYLSKTNKNKSTTKQTCHIRNIKGRSSGWKQMILVT